jgi:methionine-rich copper-binding protein CopC
MSRSPLFLAVAMAGGLAMAGPAEAHAHLVTSNPANRATVSNVNSVRLQFSETLVPAFSRAEVTMTNHHPTKLPVRISVLKDGRTMVVTSQSRLQPGSYRVNWRAVSKDTHRVDGQVTFTVR